MHAVYDLFSYLSSEKSGAAAGIFLTWIRRADRCGGQRRLSALIMKGTFQEGYRDGWEGVAPEPDLPARGRAKGLRDRLRIWPRRRARVEDPEAPVAGSRQAALPDFLDGAMPGV